MKLNLKRISYFMPLIPLLSAVLATLLYFTQGGFGGGHGSFDEFIMLLALPVAITPIAQWPVPGFIGFSGLLSVVWYPADPTCSCSGPLLHTF